MLQLLDPQLFNQLLEHKLDKDSATWSGILLSESDNGQDIPIQGPTAQHVSPKFRNVSQLVGFIPMDGFISLLEDLLECLSPRFGLHGHLFSGDTVIFGICRLLGT
ncbi:hypothetical protein WICPIJ_006416 [Wickerhamomyces pijperi]|uniref:Uncharacterized protein n=1 Tax=Wickerhamomyces pijperi TaxID=599730 RepID=A0A9P8TLF1_WICPI|nr:hypothetical protein WICPIJ_006416 [Wickerhamomyces pijperi]